MARRRRQRLVTRVGALVLALVAAAIALPTAIMVASECRELRAQLVTSSLASARVVALSSSDALASGDVDGLRSFVATYVHECSDVTRACFTDREGRVVAHSSLDAEGTLLPELAPPPARERVATEAPGGADERLVVTVPVLVSGEPFGAFQAVTSLASAEAPARDAFARAAWIGCALLALGAVAARSLAASIAAPVERLAAAADAFAAGDLSARSGIARSDEIGALGRAFDAMAGRIEEQHAALRAHSGLLEERVRERTDRLRQAETLLRSMAESSPIALLVVGEHDGRVLYCNGRLAQLWRLDAELAAPTGRSFADELRPALVARLRDASAGGAALLPTTGGAASAPAEGELLLADGRSVRCVSVPVRDDEERAIGRLCVFEDVTAARRAAAELASARDEALEAARLKSEFLANMSHEIRTPMNGVLGFVEMLGTTALDRRQRDYLETVRASGEALLAILNDILDFSKIEAGHVALEAVDFSLRDLVEGTLELLAAKAQEKGLECSGRIAPDVPDFLRGDPTRLRQVVLNLAGNAVKFTERGEVAIEASGELRSDGCYALAVSVRDTGIGIAPAVQAQLFQAFVQADGSTTRRFGGTGLGLAISRRLAELMGGTLDVESEAGRGSCFTLRVALPVVAAPAGAASRRALAGERVLVVDDHATNRRLVTELLSTAGAEAICASDGATALACARAAAAAGRPFRVALLDMQMPGMDGLELARRLAADRSLAPLELVLATSMKAATTLDPAAHGLRAVLSKPLRRALLLDALVAALAASRAAVATPDDAARDGERVAAVSPLDALRGLGRGLHLLLAEDNPVNQKLALALLARTGATVSLADDGRAAVAIWARGGVDLVLMDVQMPAMDGAAATLAIRRSEPPGRRTPIVAMTAHAMAGDRERCLACGMDDYLTKPIRPAEIARVLTQWGRRPDDGERSTVGAVVERIAADGAPPR